MGENNHSTDRFRNLYFFVPTNKKLEIVKWHRVN